MRWRSILPERLQWDDEDRPSPDINDARLRAEYYGAVYLIHRPFLLQILDNEIEPQKTQSPRSDSQQGARGTPSVFSNYSHERQCVTMAPLRPYAEDKHQPDILKFAEICINAAVQSTIAFDSITQKRLIVTNIFRTAHAWVFLARQVEIDWANTDDDERNLGISCLWQLHAIPKAWVISYPNRNLSIFSNVRSHFSVVTAIYLRFWNRMPRSSKRLDKSSLGMTTTLTLSLLKQTCFGHLDLGRFHQINQQKPFPSSKILLKQSRYLIHYKFYSLHLTEQAFVHCTHPGSSLSKHIWNLTGHLVYPFPSKFLAWSFLQHTSIKKLIEYLEEYFEKEKVVIKLLFLSFFIKLNILKSTLIEL